MGQGHGAQQAARDWDKGAFLSEMEEGERGQACSLAKGLF